MSELIEKVEKYFPTDVANHTLEIQLDQGVFRHLVFSDAGSWHQRFSLTTTPGRLVYAGDMGCFVFEQFGWYYDDILEFFRSDPTRYQPNFDYWSHKLVAVDNPGGVKEADADLFRERLETELRESDVKTQQAIDQIEEFIEECVYEFKTSGAEAAVELAHEFELETNDEDLPDFFHDVRVRDGLRYTERYVWACYAIQWGVAQYDAAKAQAEPT